MAVPLDQAEALEEALAKDPFCDDAWEVYANWLGGIDPLLGELVTMSLIGTRVGDNREHAAHVETLERTRSVELYGETLAKFIGAPRSEASKLLSLTRRFGMITAASLDYKHHDPATMQALVRAMFEQPAARMLMELSLVLPAPDLRPTFELLTARRRPALRRLALLSFYGDQFPSGVEVAVLLRTCPSLERLEIVGWIDGEVEHQTLRELALWRSDGAPPSNWSTWKLPALRKLHIQYEPTVDWPRVELPRLTDLLLHCREQGDAVLANLACADWLGRLDSLVLVESALTEHGAAILLGHASRFAAIQHVIVFDATLTPQRIAELRRALPNVQISDVDARWYGARDSLGPRRQDIIRF